VENFEQRQYVVNIINKIVQNTLGIKNFDLLEYDDARDVPGWDSLTHVIILAEIEKQFKISISLLELQAISNFDGLIDIVRGHLK